MKQLIFTFLLLLMIVFRSQAQFNLEHTYTGVSAAYVNLPVAGYKYYVMDVTNSQCRMYNADHSVWKTINLSLPAGYYLYDLQYVTENLFNTDNAIEFMYVSYTYNTTLAYYTYDTRIANESGTVLLDVPGGGYNYIYPALNGSKLFTWQYDYSVSPSTVNTLVYSIPGKVSSNAVPEYPATEQVSMREAFPNPAGSEVTIPYTLPSQVKQAELKLFTLNGVLLKAYTVDHTFESIKLQTSDLMPGTYLYRIESVTYMSETLKLVVGR